MNKFDKYAGQMYLSLLEATKYPNQEPAYNVAKWYDLFWFLIPFFGFMIFVEKIETRYKTTV